MDDQSRPEPSGLSTEIDGRLAHLQKLHPRVIDLSLGRIERLLDALGRPQDRLPPVIHLAGTNGKGSTLAFLHACLAASGKRVHTYTSPHLVRFSERIGLASAPVADDLLLDLIDRVEAANQGQEITWFEITTAIAYLAYAEYPADWLLLETGLGGRLDATNVVEWPALSVITPVSIDHQGYLGDTLEEIAAEKAGIFKPDVPAVIAPQSPVASRVLKDAALAAGTPLFAVPAQWRVESRRDGFAYRGRRWSLDLPTPALAGAHQATNAATAIACLDLLDLPGVGEAEIVAGIGKATWPGRLQRLAGMGEQAPGWQAWLDGGHNRAAADALAVWALQQPGPVWLIAALLDNRDLADFLAPFAGCIQGVIGVAGPGDHDWHGPDTVATVATGLGLKGHSAGSVEQAIALAGQQSPTGTLLVAGSLYLIGDILARYGGPDRNSA